MDWIGISGSIVYDVVLVDCDSVEGIGSTCCTFLVVLHKAHTVPYLFLCQFGSTIVSS